MQPPGGSICRFTSVAVHSMHTACQNIFRLGAEAAEIAQLLKNTCSFRKIAGGIVLLRTLPVLPALIRKLGLDFHLVTFLFVLCAGCPAGIKTTLSTLKP